MTIKYFEAFHFYFAKYVNEILASVEVPNVILYKDICYFDPENEYLKRVYRLDEFVGKMKGLLNFYLGYKEVKPNLSVVDSAEIIIKRNKKIVLFFNYFILLLLSF